MAKVIEDFRCPVDGNELLLGFEPDDIDGYPIERAFYVCSGTLCDRTYPAEWDKGAGDWMPVDEETDDAS